MCGEEKTRGGCGAAQLPELQVDPGRQVEKREFTQVSPPLLEMAPNEQAESRRCSLAKNQRASGFSPLPLLDHEPH